jgi:hypothetical protein
MEQDPDRETRDERPQVAFDYIKGHLFRVIHADGVIGGATPNGGVHLAFFSERTPIPQREVRTINSDGSLGTLLAEKSIIRPAIIREIDFDVVMSLPVAEILISWLQERVLEIKDRMASDVEGKP